MDSCARRSPAFCVTKAVLIALLAAFILYIPLGDPNKQCNSDCEGKIFGLCCLCDVYNAALRISNYVITLAQRVLCIIQNIVHELKFQFYAFLKKIDHQDLSQTVCSSDDNASERLPCKCSRRCCKKKSGVVS